MGRRRTIHRLPRVAIGLVAVCAVVLLPGANWLTVADAASTTAATLSQCTNGAVGPPLTLEQCAGSGGSTSVAIRNGAPNRSGYLNWVSGNSNGQKSHWRERE